MHITLRSQTNISQMWSTYTGTVFRPVWLWRRVSRWFLSKSDTCDFTRPNPCTMFPWSQVKQTAILRGKGERGSGCLVLSNSVVLKDKRHEQLRLPRAFRDLTRSTDRHSQCQLKVDPPRTQHLHHWDPRLSTPSFLNAFYMSFSFLFSIGLSWYIACVLSDYWHCTLTVITFFLHIISSFVYFIWISRCMCKCRPKYTEIQVCVFFSTLPQFKAQFIVNKL